MEERRGLFIWLSLIHLLRFLVFGVVIWLVSNKFIWKQTERWKLERHARYGVSILCAA